MKKRKGRTRYFYDYEYIIGVCPKANPDKFKARLTDLRHHLKSAYIMEITGLSKPTLNRLYMKYKVPLPHEKRFLRPTYAYRETRTNYAEDILPLALNRYASMHNMTVPQFLKANKEGLI